MYAERVDQVVAKNDKVFLKMTYKESVLSLTKEVTKNNPAPEHNFLEENVTLTVIGKGDIVNKQCEIEIGDNVILDGPIDLIIDIRSNENQYHRLQKHYKSLPSTEYNELIKNNTKVDIVSYGFVPAYKIAAVVKP